MQKEETSRRAGAYKHRGLHEIPIQIKSESARTDLRACGFFDAKETRSPTCFAAVALERFIFEGHFSWSPPRFSRNVLATQTHRDLPVLEAKLETVSTRAAA